MTNSEENDEFEIGDKYVFFKNETLPELPNNMKWFLIDFTSNSGLVFEIIKKEVLIKCM